MTAAADELTASLKAVRLSPVYETEPMYRTDQPKFLNAVLEGRCHLEPESLLDATSAVERKFGRRRDSVPAKGPRPLDVDILLYGSRVIRSTRLTVPHPGLCERRFVLEPLLQLAPQLTHPETGLRLAALLQALPDQGVYCYRRNPYNPGSSKEHHT